MANRVVDLRDSHLFLTSQGKPTKTGSHFGKRFPKSVKLAGVRYRKPYDTHREAACRMLAAGMRPWWCAEKLERSLDFFTTYAARIKQNEYEAR